MTKLSLVLLAGLAIAMNANAAVQFDGRPFSTHKHRTIMTRSAMEDLIKQEPRLMTVINEQPDGELKAYDRSGEGVNYNSQYGFLPTEQGGKAFVVFAPDGNTVYIKDPVSGINSGAWVEGTLQGDTINVNLGQELYYDDSYEASIVLAWGSTYLTDTVDQQGNPIRVLNFKADQQATQASYIIEGNTISLQGSQGDIYADGETAFLGSGLSAIWNDNGEWAGSIDWKTVMVERAEYVGHDVITGQPAGRLQTLMRSGYLVGVNNWYDTYYFDMQQGKVNVVWGDDGDCYMQNPFCLNAYDTWVKGHVDGNIITVPMGQYIYDNVEGEYGYIMAWGRIEVDEEGFAREMIDPEVTHAVFAYDEQAGTITLTGCTTEIPVDDEGNILTPSVIEGLMCVNTDNMTMVELDFGTQARSFELVPAVPADPVAMNWYDCGSEGGLTRFDFILPTTDVDGNPIDQECMSYSIYLDNGNGDEVFTFDAFNYHYDLVEDINVIPYSIFNKGFDFYPSHVYFYRTNSEGFEPLFTQNIGIKVYYTVSGQTNESKIAWLYAKQGGIDEATAARVVASVRYYNMAGQEITRPQGVTIQLTTYTDGSKTVAKVVK